MKLFYQRQVILTIVVILFAISARGQDMPNIIPPSPEATSLAKFIETPVSHYSGLPNINIPIYTIKEKGIEVPIALNYHARGIKVEEIASRVGIGWALNFGGSISRQTRGIADETSYGYLGQGIYDDFFTEGDTRSSTWETYSTHNEYDFVPDQFFLNANGISGKFIFDQRDGQVVLQEFDNIEISYTREGSEIASFIVKDAIGNIYYFGVSKDGVDKARNIEKTRPISKKQNEDPVLSNPWELGQFNTWHLMEIETPDSGNIKFSYGTPEDPQYYRRSYDKMIDNVPNSYFSQVDGMQYQLKEISFSTGKLVFNPCSTKREDLGNTYALDNIELYDLNNNLQKKFQFSYSYTTAPTNGNILGYLGSVDTKAGKRLFLDSVQEINTESPNDDIPPYTFEYSTALLPNRFSNSQDVWGYFNGANNGEFLTFFNYSTFSVDRKVHVGNSEAGMLKKIAYPTGGYTEFTYEQNIAVPDAVMKGVVGQATNPVVVRNEGLGFLDISNYDSYANEYTKLITIGNIIGVVDISSLWIYNIDEMDFTFSIRPTSGSPVYSITLGSDFIDIGTGEYYLKAKPTSTNFDPFNPNHGFNINLTWEEQAVSESDSVYAAGKRIKKIEKKLSASNTATIREYKYENSGGISSGKIHGLPNVYTVNKILSNGSYVVFEPCGSVPGSPLSMGQGNSIGYSNVTEYLGDISNNSGKIDYEFMYIKNTGDFYTWPYTIPTDNEWLRGKPRIIDYFERNADGSYELVKNVQHDYHYADLGPLPTAFDPVPRPTNLIPIITDITDIDQLYYKDKRLFRFPLAIFASKLDDNGQIILDSIHYKVHYLTGGTSDLKKTITTEYVDNSPSLETTLEYFYDYDDHYQLSKSETGDSKGGLIKYNYYYPPDYNVGVDNYSTLIANNIIGKPIDVRTYNGSQLISGTQTKYNADGQPIETRSAEINGTTDIAFEADDPYSFTTKATYAYNTNKNLKQVSLTDNINTGYLWGYGSNYVVAKVENATSAQVEGCLNSTELSNIRDGSYSDNDMRTALNKIRTTLTNAVVTTYTYKPLVGITSQTDPAGRTTYYEYDSFGRLKFVKDQNQNIVSKNEYHYAGQL